MENAFHQPYSVVFWKRHGGGVAIKLHPRHCEKIICIVHRTQSVYIHRTRVCIIDKLSTVACNANPECLVGSTIFGIGRITRRIFRIFHTQAQYAFSCFKTRADYFNLALDLVCRSSRLPFSEPTAAIHRSCTKRLNRTSLQIFCENPDSTPGNFCRYRRTYSMATKKNLMHSKLIFSSDTDYYYYFFDLDKSLVTYDCSNVLLSDSVFTAAV